MIYRLYASHRLLLIHFIHNFIYWLPVYIFICITNTITIPVNNNNSWHIMLIYLTILLNYCSKKQSNTACMVWLAWVYSGIYVLHMILFHWKWPLWRFYRCLIIFIIKCCILITFYKSSIKYSCYAKWISDVKGILSVDLFTFSNNLTKAILLFYDNTALIQIYRNVFTACIHITICELLIYYFN